ncbi:thiol-activated cytolysin family protein [Prevotella histicola]|uniref:thiol-activated cytolysin family protein n=1 Tax=Prevotella histicola TaxID=470565 RepID=UPI001C5F5F03|nr:thiol-activated cytolysin family protein [Prevotella histicola]MBW4777294.1 thiol-activated cytolysin family protein [Prevotella histicola]
MKKNLLKAVLPVSLALFAVTFGSCSQDGQLTGTKEDTGERVLDNTREIQNYLRSLPLAPMMSRASDPVPSDDGTTVPVDEGTSKTEEKGVLNGIPGSWVKTTRRYKMTQAFDESFLFDPTSDIIYPGCVLKGGTIANGTYAIITSHETGDVTFSINLSPANPQEARETSATVHNIRKSEYQEVWNKWANMQWKESPITTIESVEKINSQEELATKLGVAVNSPVANGSLNFGFNFNKKKNHILARLIQKYFSVSTDAPKKGNIFESIDKEALDGYQPVYISNINYGRIIYLSVESDEDEKVVDEAINFAMNQIKGVDVSVSADQSLHYRKVLANCDIRITVLGGGQTIQKEVLKGDIDSFQRFLNADIPMEQMSPISFSLRYAVDNSQARVVTSNEFTVTQRDFVPEFKKVRMQLQVLGFSGTNTGPFPNLDREAGLWGSISLSLNGQDNELVKISQSNPFFFNYREKKETMHPIGFGGIVTVEFDKDPNESLEDFVDHQKMTFVSDLHSTRSIYNYNFGRTTFTHTLGTLYTKYKGDDPIFVLESNNKNVKIHTYVKVLDMKFFNK